MNVPGSVDQLLLFVLFVLPGITFSTVRVALSGWKAPDFGVGARVLEALFVSAIFDGIYLLVLGEALVSKVKATKDVLSLVSTLNVFVSLLLLIGVPALVAVVVYLKPTVEKTTTKRGGTWFRVVTRNNYRSTPQAWDFKVLNAGGQFVRVRMESGVYYGGWYSRNSLASTYPHDRDMFIESQWKLDNDGRFIKKMKDTAGVWIPIGDKTVVEWLNPPAPTDKEETHG